VRTVDFLGFKQKIGKTKRVNIQELFNTPIISRGCVIFSTYTIHTFSLKRLVRPEDYVKVGEMSRQAVLQVCVKLS